MDDVRKLAEERAARPSSVPAGSSFESERQKQKAALVRQIDELDGSKIRKISAASEKVESNKTLRVAAYCRVSTDDIDQAISIELQMRQYKEKIKSNPDWKYAGTYVDNGFSGTNTAHRPGFLKLIEDARAGKIDMIIARKHQEIAEEQNENAKSFYYPPEEDDEPQELMKIAEQVQRELEIRKKIFGIPAFKHTSAFRSIDGIGTWEEWLAPARPAPFPIK